MRTKMKYIVGSFVFMISIAFAGGSQGGGTPMSFDCQEWTDRQFGKF